jgi:hypothetical protein
MAHGEQRQRARPVANVVHNHPRLVCLLLMLSPCLIVKMFTEMLAAESEQQRQQVIDLVLPYVILPFRVRATIARSRLLNAANIWPVSLGIRATKSFRLATSSRVQGKIPI